MRLDDLESGSITDAPSWYHRVIAGDVGVAGGPLRSALRMVSLAYGAAIRARNRMYDRAVGTQLPVPVISVGNITTGGTGKTPLVMELARRLRRHGRKPAVVSRGYKSGPAGKADELLMIHRHIPDMPCVADPDRVAGARRAVDDYGADVILLDDGFQHRRIGRDLDLVVIDATCPFGYGHLLPRGLLREPLTALQRASLIVLSRTDQVPPPRLEDIDAVLDRAAPNVRRIRAVHRPAGLVRLDGTDPKLGPLDVGRAFCFAAIGNPAAFRATVGSLGIELADVRWWPDHHIYDERDADAVQAAARRCDASVLLTTEKDAVKLTGLAARWSLPVYALRIEIDFPSGHATILASALEEAVNRSSQQNARDPQALQAG